MTDARNPATGWIKPKIDDRIIAAARLGASMHLIALDLEQAQTHVERVLRRAYLHNFITDAEALALGILSHVETSA
jgi:hypothetical protein